MFFSETRCILLLGSCGFVSALFLQPNHFPTLVHSAQSTELSALNEDIGYTIWAIYLIKKTLYCMWYKHVYWRGYAILVIIWAECASDWRSSRYIIDHFENEYMWFSGGRPTSSTRLSLTVCCIPFSAIFATVQQLRPTHTDQSIKASYSFDDSINETLIWRSVFC